MIRLILVLGGIGLAAATLVKMKGAPVRGTPAMDGWWRVLIEVVGGVGEGSGSWSTLNPDDNHAGISVGFLQFNQGSGSLGDLLAEWRKSDPAGFAQWSASWAGEVEGLLIALRSSERAARLTPYLASPTWRQRWQATSGFPGWRDAQRTIAWRSYFAPVQAPAIGVGLQSVAASGLVFDRAINQGAGAVKATLQKMAAEPRQRTETDRAVRFRALMVARLAGDPEAQARVNARCDRVIRALAAKGYALGTSADPGVA